MKCASVLLAVGCLVIAVAQEWQVELVDTSCRPSDAFVKRDSDRTYVAYVTSEGMIRIAFKDTIWHYETLDTGLVRPERGFHFALGPAGRMAVSGLDDSTRPVVFERSDSVWSRIWTREPLGHDCGPARAVYVADGVPAVIYCNDESGVTGDVIVETRPDSLWRVDTAKHFSPGGENVGLTLYDADGSEEAGPCFLIEYAEWLPKSAQLWMRVAVYKGYRSGADWSLVGLGGGLYAAVDGYDIVAGGPHTASAAAYAGDYSGGYTLFDRDSVWPGRARDAAVQVDSAGRDLTALVTPDSVLRFAFKGGFWHFYEVPGVTTAARCDLALDDAGQPLLAFVDSIGIWLARGINIVGMEENHVPQAAGRRLAATVVRSLPPGTVVFDAMGRRVRNPRAGIYFLGEGLGARVQGRGRMRKVVLQR